MVKDLSKNAPEEPGWLISPNGNHGQINGSQALPNFFEHRTVACVASKPYTLLLPLHTVAAPEGLPPISQRSGAPVLRQSKQALLSLPSCSSVAAKF